MRDLFCGGWSLSALLHWSQGAAMLALSAVVGLSLNCSAQTGGKTSGVVGDGDPAGAPADVTVRREGQKVWLDGVPSAPADGNGYLRGLETLLACEEAPVDHDRLMGLSGLAFVLQADAKHRWEGTIDCGWWPMDPWGLALRREFLSKAIGYELVESGVFFDPARWGELKGDKARAHYNREVAPVVRKCIDAGKPALSPLAPSKMDWAYLIGGYSAEADGRPPVWGRCARTTDSNEWGRSDDWPLGVLTVGRRLEPMDCDAADIAALRHAIALARDEAGPTEERYRDIRFTGAKAWALWAALLRNAEEPVADGGQWNVRRNLIVNRSAAVAYLREVASRHEGGPAGELSEAADAYEKVIELARVFKPGGAAKDMDKRRALAEKVDRMAAAELRAVAHLAKAVDAMQAARPITFTGECLCGAVKYRVEGAIRQCNFCDCAGCRRASGALRVPWVVVARKDLKVTAGQLKRVRGDKSKYRKCEAHGERAICPACGTNLFWYGDRGDSVDIAAGTLDDLSVFKPDQAR